MRVNPDTSADLLNALDYAQSQQSKSLLEMSSGRRINQPSDDPSGAAALVEIHSQQAAVETHSSNAAATRSLLETSDSALNSVVLALQRAAVLGVQAANGTLSDNNRAAIANELSGLKDQLLELANTSYEGNFIFGGNQTDTKPFVSDNTQASGVLYQGDGAVSQVEVGEGLSVQSNLPGDQIFSKAGSDVFLAIQNLVVATTTGTGIGTSTADVRAALDYVSSQRVFYGTTMQEVDTASKSLDQQKINLSQQETDVAGADMAAAITNMLNAQTAYNALLGAAAKQSKLTLFDYLT